MTRPLHDAYTADGRTVPSEAFYAIACDPARHVVVEACAGAGKTWMLVSRVLRALLAGAEPQQILAITFTKKAAAEMRQRLNQWLAEFADMPLDKLVPELTQRGMTPEQAKAEAPALQALYLRLLQHGRSVQIRTFHSWFAALLRAAPLQLLQQLGLPSQYELLEDDQRAVAEVWRPFHQALLEDPSAMADYQALVMRNGRSNTLKALVSALSKRVEFVLADQQGVVEASVPDFRSLVPELGECATPAAALDGEAASQRWHARSSLLSQEKNKTPRAAAEKVVEAFLQPDLEQRLQQLRAAFFVKDADRLTQHLTKFDAAQDAAAELERLCLAQAQHESWLYQQRMARLTRVLLRCYAEVKRSHGWVDMNDIEQTARLLLQDELLSGWIQERLDAQLRHLLVDEFQDTNPMQWQALHAWLSGYTGAATAPSVFIVGDPKQSIYRFRRADPQVFRAAKEFVRTGLGGAELSCDHTRRNSQPVIDAVNAVMLAAQQEGRYQDFRAHTTASDVPGCVLALPQIARPEKPQEDGPRTRRNSLTTPKVEEEEELKQRECRQAASWLQRCVQAGTAPEDILVIARTNDRIATMQWALAQVGLPAHKADKMRLAEAPEVQDVVALVDALISPRHDVSLARALKSPIFGLDDAELVQIALGVRAMATAVAGGDGVRVSWLDWLLEQSGDSPWQALAGTLRRWQGWLQQRLPHDALDAIYRDGDLLARYRACTPASQRASVVERLQALPGHTLALDGGRYANAYHWVRALRGSDPTPAPQAGGKGIRLLTIHGAKGLEAGLVLLLDTDAAKGRARTMDVLVRWPGEAPHPDSLVFIEKASAPPPSARLLLAEEQQAEEREEANALYVAMTRAAQVLAFSSAEPRSGQPASWWQQWTGQAQPDMLEADAQGNVGLPSAGWPGIGKKEVAKEAPCGQKGETNPWPVPARGADLLELAPLAAHASRGAATTQLLARDPQLQLQGRMGEAMHKALEWYRPHAGAAELARQQQALQQLYGLDQTQGDTVLQQARAIVQGDAGWAWDAEQLEWEANEVDIASDGKVLRLDRLVRRKAEGERPACWWVLDFKSSLAPEQQQGLRGQLEDYRQAVGQLHAGEPVQAAFLTAEGRLVVL